jgi:orotate phosphoribosyltransferase
MVSGAARARIRPAARRRGAAHDTLALVSWDARKQELAGELIRRLYAAGVVRTWLRDQPAGWELMSGAWSPFYVNFRDAPADPELFRFVVDAGAELVREELPEATQLVGLAAAGVPFAAGCAYRLGLPLGYTRKLSGVRRAADLTDAAAAESYGSHRLVEGAFRPGDRVALVDDLVTGFDSKEIALRQLELELERRGVEDVRAVAVVVFLERGAEARSRAAAAGVRLVSLLALDADSVEHLRGAASDRELDVIAAYLRDPEPFQEPARRAELTAEATTAAAR